MVMKQAEMLTPNMTITHRYPPRMWLSIESANSELHGMRHVSAKNKRKHMVELLPYECWTDAPSQALGKLGQSIGASKGFGGGRRILQ